MHAEQRIPKTALVLVGGFGTRLRSMVPDRPKALAMIAGRPFLAWELDALAAQGITRVILCTHYLSEMIEAEFPPGLLPNGISVVYSRETEPLGTGGALRLGVQTVPMDTDDVLAINGDTFCRFDFKAMWAAHLGLQAKATVLLTSVGDVSRYGSVETSEDGKILAFHEKTAAIAGPGWINAGVYLLSCALLRSLPIGRAISIERELFPAWIGRDLWACRGGTHFLDIGTPESYSQAEQYLALASKS